MHKGNVLEQELFAINKKYKNGNSVLERLLMLTDKELLSADDRKWVPLYIKNIDDITVHDVKDLGSLFSKKLLSSCLVLALLQKIDQSNVLHKKWCMNQLYNRYLEKRSDYPTASDNESGDICDDLNLYIFAKSNQLFNKETQDKNKLLFRRFFRQRPSKYKDFIRNNPQFNGLCLDLLEYCLKMPNTFGLDTFSSNNVLMSLLGEVFYDVSDQATKENIVDVFKRSDSWFLAMNDTLRSRYEKDLLLNAVTDPEKHTRRKI